MLANAKDKNTGTIVGLHRLRWYYRGFSNSCFTGGGSSYHCSLDSTRDAPLPTVPGFAGNIGYF